MNDDKLIKSLLPAQSLRTTLEHKYIKRILEAEPGLGEKSIELANSLVESGLPDSAAAMILQAVYLPTSADGRGQGTRAKWFVEAIQNRYSNRMEKIKTDYRAFRSFLSDMEDVTGMRDELNGNGFSCSFQLAFLLWELGEDANSVQVAIDEHLDHLLGLPGSCMARVSDAAMAVQRGEFTEVATALQFLNQRTIVNDENYGQHYDGLDRPENW